MHRKTPVRFTASVRDQPSRSMQSTVPGAPVIPALLTAQSSRPKAESAAPTAAATSASEATSMRAKRAEPPAASISATAARPPPSSMSQTSTRAPSRARRLAVARPMPDAAPVTSADFPCTSPPDGTRGGYSGAPEKSPSKPGAFAIRRRGGALARRDTGSAVVLRGRRPVPRVGRGPPPLPRREHERARRAERARPRPRASRGRAARLRELLLGDQRPRDGPLHGPDHARHGRAPARAVPEPRLAGLPRRRPRALGARARAADDRRARGRDRAEGIRRARARGHEPVPGAGDRRDRRRPAHRSRALPGVGAGDRDGARRPRARRRRLEGDARVPAPLRRGPPPRAPRRPDQRPRPRRDRRAAPRRRGRLRLPAPADARRRRDHLPRDGQLPRGPARAPGGARAPAPRPIARPARGRGDAALGDLDHDGEPPGDARHGDRRLPRRGGLLGPDPDGLGEPRRGALRRSRRVGHGPPRAPPPRLRSEEHTSE